MICKYGLQLRFAFLDFARVPRTSRFFADPRTSVLVEAAPAHESILPPVSSDDIWPHARVANIRLFKSAHHKSHVYTYARVKHIRADTCLGIS